MKKPMLIALFISVLAAALTPVAGYAQPVCAYPAQWVWRGYWNCEYPARVYYAPPYYPYYGYAHGYYGGYAGRAYPGGGYYGGCQGAHRNRWITPLQPPQRVPADEEPARHVGGGVRGGGGHSGGGGGHSDGGHGGHR